MRMLSSRVLTVAAALLAWCAIGADEAPVAAPRQESRGGGRSRSGMRERFAEIERQLKEKFPAEYAEVEKMRETDRFGAMRKMEELAEKAGIEMPFGRRGMRPRPAEKAGLEMPKGELPKSVQSERKIELNRNRNRILIANANRILARTRPDDYAKLQALREVDDDAARAFFRKLAREEGLTPARLLGEPIPQVRSVSYSDKDIEAQNPMPSNTINRGWGGRGGWGGGRGNWGGGR